MNCVLSLSHRNLVPERGFSMNKIMLKSHGYTIDNDTIVALSLVKDSIGKEDGSCQKLLRTIYKAINKCLLA